MEIMKGFVPSPAPKGQVTTLGVPIHPRQGKEFVEREDRLRRQPILPSGHIALNDDCFEGDLIIYKKFVDNVAFNRDVIARITEPILIKRIITKWSAGSIENYHRFVWSPSSDTSAAMVANSTLIHEVRYSKTLADPGTDKSPALPSYTTSTGIQTTNDITLRYPIRSYPIFLKHEFEQTSAVPSGADVIFIFEIRYLTRLMQEYIISPARLPISVFPTLPLPVPSSPPPDLSFINIDLQTLMQSANQIENDIRNLLTQASLLVKTDTQGFNQIATAISGLISQLQNISNSKNASPDLLQAINTLSTIAQEQLDALKHLQAVPPPTQINIPPPSVILEEIKTPLPTPTTDVFEQFALQIFQQIKNTVSEITTTLKKHDPFLYQKKRDEVRELEAQLTDFIKSGELSQVSTQIYGQFLKDTSYFIEVISSISFDP
jgi:hypothetical protein